MKVDEMIINSEEAKSKFDNDITTRKVAGNNLRNASNSELDPLIINLFIE